MNKYTQVSCKDTSKWLLFRFTQTKKKPQKLEDNLSLLKSHIWKAPFNSAKDAAVDFPNVWRTDRSGAQLQGVLWVLTQPGLNEDSRQSASPLLSPVHMFHQTRQSSVPLSHYLQDINKSCLHIDRYWCTHPSCCGLFTKTPTEALPYRKIVSFISLLFSYLPCLRRQIISLHNKEGLNSVREGDGLSQSLFEAGTMRWISKQLLSCLTFIFMCCKKKKKNISSWSITPSETGRFLDSTSAARPQ